MELCNAHLMGARKFMLPFPKGVKPLAHQQSLGGVCSGWDCEEPNPVPSVCLENKLQGRALQAEHELSVRPGLPGALAEVPLPYLPHF